MRKPLIILFLSVIGIATLSAQELGFIGGASLTHGTIVSADPKASFGQIPGGGLHLGVLFEWNFTNRWGVEAAAMYEMRHNHWNLNYDSVPTTTRFNRRLGYFNVPAHLFVDFPTQRGVTFSIFGGPVFTCGLHATDWAWMMNDVRKPVTYKTTKMFDKTEGRLVRCEIAAELGFALKWNRLQGRLSYQYGFNNGTKNQYLYTLPMTKGTASYYTQGEVRLSVAYLFDLRR